MIAEFGMQLLEIIIGAIFSLLDILPDMPPTITNAIDSFFDLIWQGVNLVSFFLPMDTVVILIPIVIAIVNFDKIWKLIMFILRKIPFVGIK